MIYIRCYLFFNIELILCCLLIYYMIMIMNCLQVMFVLKVSIQSGIIDVILIWFFFNGCIVINVLENVFVIFDGEMFILYCIILGNVEEVCDNLKIFSNLFVYFLVI